MLRFSLIGYRSLLKTNFVKVKCRSIHVARRTRPGILQNARIFDTHLPDSKVLTVLCIRYASTGDADPAEVVDSLDSAKEAAVTRIDLTSYSQSLINQPPDLPNIPPIPEVIEVLPKLHANGEIAFESLGLGGYSPVGIIQNILEWLHISCNLPWWGAITVVSLIVRIMLFPLVVSSQKHIALISKHMPQVQEKQRLLAEARQCGDEYQAAILSNELYTLIKKNKISPFYSLRTIFVQGPIFISFYIALRRMTNLPVESLKTGGLWWFTDLTIIDPYYILPIVVGTTLFATIELGSAGNVKHILRFIPIIIVPVTATVPAGISYYWLMSNFSSLVQLGILKIPYVRQALKLPKETAMTIKPKEKKPFLKGFKDSWDNMKVTKQLADRERGDEMQFQSAARSPIIKTYKYDPTKQYRNK